MAKTPEGLVKDAVKKTLDEFGVWYCMPMGTGFGRSGIPDFICCANGRLLAIETKAGQNTATALQKRELRRIEAAGGVAIVVNEENLSELRKLLNETHSDGKPIAR